MVYPLQHGFDLSNGSVYEIFLGEVWFVGFNRLDEFTSAKQGRSKQDGVLTFFGHWVLREISQRKGRSILLLIPDFPKLLDGRRSVPVVVVVRVGKYFEVSGNELAVA
jgi:hypothetical protein